MNKLFAIFAALLVIGVLAPQASAETRSYEYTAGPLGAPWIWCDGGGHGYLPEGTPNDFTTTDPTDDPLGYVFEVEGWAASGEPECAPGDLATGDQAHGWGSVAIDVTGFLGGRLVASVSDDNFDATGTYISNGEDVFWDCGVKSIQIPRDLERHAQSSVEDPYYLMWADIDVAYVDTDTLEMCFGSTGSLTGVLE